MSLFTLTYWNKVFLKSKTVICIDTSFSTRDNQKYFKKIRNILKRENNKIVITWNSRAEITESKDFLSFGETRPQTFLNIIKDFQYDYNLIVTTNGQIYDSDVAECKAMIESSKLLDRIQSFKMYFIGDTQEMNLKISSLFNKLKNKQLIINYDKPINVPAINSVEDLKYDDFKKNKVVIAGILTLLQTYPDKKEEMKMKMCKVANSIIGEIATKSSIRKFYEKNDIDGCVEFVKKYDNSENETFQRVMSEILNIFKEDDQYDLCYFTQKKVMADDIVDYYGYDPIVQDYSYCDILLTKCSFPCILVKLIEDPDSSNKDKFSIIPDELSKEIAEHPFLILNRDTIIQKIIERVEYKMIYLSAYDQLKDKSKSPFTRDPLKGVFIFHNDTAGYNLIFNNNSRTISFIFGKNDQLPGNKVVWNVLFLYILVKYHPVWKEHEIKLKNEILYICKNVTSLITLTPRLNPIIRDKFEVCLWYIVNVAPKAFANASNDVLRYIEGSERFVEFYSYLYGKK